MQYPLGSPLVLCAFVFLARSRADRQWLPKLWTRLALYPVYIFSFLCADTCQLTISNTPAKARYTISCLLVKAKKNNSCAKDIVKQFLGSVSLERFFQTNTRFYLCLSLFTAIRLNRKILNSYSFGHLIPYRAKRGWIVP